MKNEYEKKLDVFKQLCTERKEFYRECGDILGIPHTYTDPVIYRTRWNNRLIGNGRFPGFGTIQCFGSSIRVISKKHGTQMFTSYSEVFAFLKT